MPPHPDSAALVSKLWRASAITVTTRDYTYPVYYAAQATATYTVKCRYPDWGNLHGKTIRWNPAWKPSHGFYSGNDDYDNQVIVLDPATGREWNLWQVKAPDTVNRILRCGSASLVPGSYWTKTDGFKPPRGCGIQCFAMLTTAAEVRDGAIRHALSMPTRGIDKTAYVPPATKTDGGTAAYAVAGGIPMGTRFALRVTDAELAAWAAGRQSALVIGRAVRDYGLIVTDNAGATHVQLEDRKSAGAAWDALGLTYPRDLLRGLVREDRLYATAVA
jgi:hypothetical protein